MIAVILQDVSFFVTRSANNDITNNNRSQYCFSFNEPQLVDKSRINITIEPTYLNNLDMSKQKEKWLVNLTSFDIPDTVRDLLPLSKKFALPSQCQKNRMALEIIKDVENNIKQSDQTFKFRIRLLVSSSLEHFINEHPHLNNFERNIIESARFTNNFIKDFIKDRPSEQFVHQS